MKTIQIKCSGSINLDVDSLVDFQGDLKDLPKENYERLKKEIVETGFAFPINVWKQNDDWKIISGHQRVRTLKTMRRLGYEIPLIPCVEIHADSEKEAKRRVLQDASSYGVVNEQGFLEFLNDSQMDLDFAEASFRLPDLKWDKLFEANAPEIDLGALDEGQRSSSDGVKQIVLKFDLETAKKVENYCEVLGHQHGTSSISDTIYRTLEWAFGTQR